MPVASYMVVGFLPLAKFFTRRANAWVAARLSATEEDSKPLMIFSEASRTPSMLGKLSVELDGLPPGDCPGVDMLLVNRHRDHDNKIMDWTLAYKTQNYNLLN